MGYAPVHSPCYISTITNYIITGQGWLIMSGFWYISSSFQVDLLPIETFVEEFKLNKTNSVAFQCLFPWQPSLRKELRKFLCQPVPSSFAIQEAIVLTQHCNLRRSAYSIATIPPWPEVAHGNTAPGRKRKPPKKRVPRGCLNPHE